MHTIGPWRINDMPLPSRKVIEIKKNGEIIANIPYHSKGKCYAMKQINDETRANVNLIAAAPELLAACKDTLDIMLAYQHIPVQKKPCMILQLQAVIKKAEGKP